MEELGYFLEPIPICGDNQGLIEIFYIKGTKNLADMFTKNLGQEALNNC